MCHSSVIFTANVLSDIIERVPPSYYSQVPTDMGVLWTKFLFAESNHTPSQIEMFFRLKTGPSGVRGNYATYESAG
jgi:hypothetical protein